MNYNFIKELKPSNNHDNFILNIADKYSSLSNRKVNTFKKRSIDKTIALAKAILTEIDNDYYNLFSKMIVEEDCDKPVIYTLTSNNEIKENESNTYRNEIYFYKTDTEADVYILLHEFSHFLTNRKNSYLNDLNNKKYNEIIPILMEFIISNYIKDDNYLKLRENEIIYNSKSMKIKEEIGNGNFDVEYLLKKYSLNSYEKEKFINDIIYSRNLEYEEEIRYNYGYLYAYYYSLNNPISNYKSLVEKYTTDRNISLPKLKMKQYIQVKK